MKKILSKLHHFYSFYIPTKLYFIQSFKYIIENDDKKLIKIDYLPSNKIKYINKIKKLKTFIKITEYIQSK